MTCCSWRWRCRRRTQRGPLVSCPRMSDSRPIGVFDSGVGGLTVLRELRRRLPAERLLYVADLEHFPYGPRPQRQVRDLAMGIIAMLVTMDTKLVVIACNTATAAALHVAREHFDIPIIGVIAPGAQAAASATRTGRIAVLSTEGTRASGEYVHAIKEAEPGGARPQRGGAGSRRDRRGRRRRHRARRRGTRSGARSASSPGTPTRSCSAARTTRCCARRSIASSATAVCVWSTAPTRPPRA